MIGPLLGVVSGFTGSILLGVHKSRRLQAGRDAEAELMCKSENNADSSCSVDSFLSSNLLGVTGKWLGRTAKCLARSLLAKMGEHDVTGMVLKSEQALLNISFQL